MRQASKRIPESAEKTVRDIRRATRRHHSAEEKIRYLSTVLDDFSRYILAWKLCTTMSATDVSDTLQVALRGSGLNQVKVLHRPRLLSDNGPSYAEGAHEATRVHHAARRRGCQWAIIIEASLPITAL